VPRRTLKGITEANGNTEATTIRSIRKAVAIRQHIRAEKNMGNTAKTPKGTINMDSLKVKSMVRNLMEVLADRGAKKGKNTTKTRAIKRRVSKTFTTRKSSAITKPISTNSETKTLRRNGKDLTITTTTKGARSGRELMANNTTKRNQLAITTKNTAKARIRRTMRTSIRRAVITTSQATGLKAIVADISHIRVITPRSHIKRAEKAII
ncbi:unnamed protein product, partial [Medioppia subpectinata]